MKRAQVILFATVLSTCLCLAFPAAAGESGLRLKTDLNFRFEPVGVSAFNDIGYRLSLSDSESMFLKDTYVEGGAFVSLSPGYIWAGGYVESLPVAVLLLRAQVQYMKFFGNFGYAFTPLDQENPTWNLVDIEASAEADRGQALSGLNAELKVVPRAKVGRFVLLLETIVSHVRWNTDGFVHEPFHDTLGESADTTLLFKPTAGVVAYQGNGTYLVTAVRYEHAETFGTDLDRDLVAGLILWGIPKGWLPENTKAQLAVIGGSFFNHPTDREGRLYAGSKLTVSYGAH